MTPPLNKETEIAKYRISFNHNHNSVSNKNNFEAIYFQCNSSTCHIPIYGNEKIEGTVYILG